MLYPYICDTCGPFEVPKPMSEASRPEPCPQCSSVIQHQDYAAKNINGGVGTEGNWSGGKIVSQLPPSHPDYYVTSKRQMEKVYKRNGISMETAKFCSKADQIKATVPVRFRTGTTPGAVGGVDG
jgi:putative FmdB family regulatory protein